MTDTPASRRTAIAGGLAAAATLAAPALALPDPPSGVRRVYFDGPFGQIHARVAAGPRGRNAASPLVLLHQTPLSGRMFERIMPALASGRTVIAVDSPGYGESDRPAAPPTLSQYGDAILAALLPRYGARFDLLGYHTGAVIAADIAARTRAARRLVLVSFPLFDVARREALLAQLDAPEPPYAADGSHLLAMWTGTMQFRPQGQTVDDAARLVSEKLRPGRYREWALRAAMANDLSGTLAGIAVPTLAMAPLDGLEDATARAAALIAGCTLTPLPALGYGLFDAAPGALAAAIVRFLDRR